MILLISIFLLLLASFSTLDSSLQFADSADYLPNACDSSYQESLVEEMNQKRSYHQVLNLLLDPNNCYLAQYVQKMADFLAGKGYRPPRPPIDFSEFYADLNRSRSAAIEADEMYHIGDHYPYYGRDPPNATELKKYIFFTQMIWKASQQVTFGCSDSGGFRYLVAAFVPPGNVRGQFADNVLRPRHHDEASETEQ